MDKKERTTLINNILRANNELIDKKWLLNQNRSNQRNLLTDKRLVNQYPYIKGIESTVKSLFIDELEKERNKLISDIEILKKYIRLRTTRLIGIKKVNNNYKYRFFGETQIKNGELVVFTKTISKGSPIDYISTHDLNRGIINLCELILDYKTRKIVDTIDYLFEIRSGRLLRDFTKDVSGENLKLYRPISN